jgi:hypothetical protein
VKTYIPRIHVNEDGSHNVRTASQCLRCQGFSVGMPDVCPHCHAPFRAEAPEGMDRLQAIKAYDRKEQVRQGRVFHGPLGPLGQAAQDRRAGRR